MGWKQNIKDYKRSLSNRIKRKRSTDMNKMMWVDKFEGKAKGGYFYRTRMGKDIAEFERKFKVTVVGVVVDDSWNAEFIIKEKE